MSAAIVGERIVPERFALARDQYLLYLRHLYAYEFAAAEIPPGASVLEVGCGEGYGTHRLSQSVKNIVGLDVDRRAVEHAPKKYPSANCSFRLYDGVRIPFGPDSFEAAVSFQVIEHLEDDRRYVAEIRRVLKPGGIFLLTTPNKTYRLKPGQKPWNKYHKREYYPGELEEVLKASFTEVKVWGIRGRDEVQEIEMAKVRPRSPLVSLLKRLVPESAKLALIKTRKALEKTLGKNEDFVGKYSLEDFYIIRENVERSLDLLAVCKK